MQRAFIVKHAETNVFSFIEAKQTAPTLKWNQSAQKNWYRITEQHNDEVEYNVLQFELML